MLIKPLGSMLEALAGNAQIDGLLDVARARTALVKASWSHKDQVIPQLGLFIADTKLKAIEYYNSATWFQLLQNAIVFYVVCQILQFLEHFLQIYGLFGSIKQVVRTSTSYVVSEFFKLPIISYYMEKELQKVVSGIEESVIKRDPTIPSHAKLPEKGLSVKAVEKIMDKMTVLKRTDWENGRCTGAVYHGGKELVDLQTEVYGRYAVANQLHPDCFPDVRQMESEVVSMVLDLYHGPKGSCGTSTSGGTESLLLTCLAARQRGLLEKGITKPEMVCPVTIHAGFDKAAYYFNIKLIHAPIDPRTYQVDLKAVEKLVSNRTILIAGSVPNYPHGVADDIQGLGKIAQKYDIPLHVDCCLGSFVVPFINLPPFDFRVSGVTSISCDTHKYGFAPKGSSIIMYRSPKLRRYQYFVSTDWTGGLYASPTLAGSRPGALMAGCWATLLHIGKEGYKKLAGDIVRASMKFKSAVQNDPLLKQWLFVIGEPVGSVVAIGSNKLNIYDLSDLLGKKGWHLGALQSPASIHLAVTRLTVPVIDELIHDLKTCVEQQVKTGSKAAKGETKAVYGAAGSVVTAGFAGLAAEGFVDALYKL